MHLPGVSVVKNPPAHAGDAGSIPGLGRSPGGGNGNPRRYSCLENYPMDRGAWRPTVPAAQSLSRVQLFAAPWTAAHQASLSMGFSRQEYWSELPFLIPGDPPNPGIEPMSLVSLALWADSLPTEAPGGDSPWAPGGDSPWGRRRVRHSLLTKQQQMRWGRCAGQKPEKSKGVYFLCDSADRRLP